METCLKLEVLLLEFVKLSCELPYYIACCVQVFISYGKRSSGELLLAYGFIPPELNPHDFVELELALNEEDPLYDAKLAALQEQGLSSYP
jgi:hypothetical protein